MTATNRRIVAIITWMLNPRTADTDANQGYEAPKVVVLGSVSELTAGYATPGTEGYDDGSQE